MSGRECDCQAVLHGCYHKPGCAIYAGPPPATEPTPAPSPSPVWPDDATVERVAEDETPNAPAWVQSVTPAAIVDQRQRGWPDFHPEDFCHECGQRNPLWFASQEDWSVVFADRDGIVCPTCFSAMHCDATGTRTCWQLAPDAARAALSVLPDPTADTVLLDQIRAIVAEWDDRGATWCMKRIAALLAGGEAR